jgi:hypothetical protein
MNPMYRTASAIALVTLVGCGGSGDTRADSPMPAFSGVASAGRPSVSSAVGDTLVLDWNLVSVQAVGSTPPFPSTRAMASVQLAVFDAVNAITQRYQPYLGGISAPAGASAEAAVVAAAHDVLAWLFPAQSSFLDLKQAESLALMPDGDGKNAGIAVGRAAAAAIIANRTNDGAQTPMFHTPTSTDPYEWQPTPTCATAPANGRGLFFHWQFVKPFGVASASQFRAGPPPVITGGKYAIDFNEVTTLGGADSTLRTEHQANAARLFGGSPPHRAWNLVARQLAGARGDEITQTARTLALLNMSLADAHITIFESKYHYRGWRPETAIQRAADDGNDKTAVTAFQPFVAAPCFPGYPSAHGVGGGAARTILWRAYGRKHHDITLSDAAVPGIVLRYTDLVDITDDVTIARVAGGIHFRIDQDVADRIGADIARYNDERWLMPVAK